MINAVVICNYRCCDM